MTAQRKEGSSARALIAVGIAGAFAMSAIQCASGGDDAGEGSGKIGSSGGSSSGGSGGSSTGGSVGVGGSSLLGDSGLIDAPPIDYGLDAFFVNDPPPPSCNGNMNTPVQPGGTPECPADKNLEGCECFNVGETAACWPGFRRHRGKGACQDGTTECIQIGENQFVWGPCEGFQGISPTTFEPLGTSGKAACGCFSGGFWSLTNTSPCFIFSDPNQMNVVGSVSTRMTDMMGGAECPSEATMIGYFNDPTPPADPFTSNTVRSDCAGFFKLCYTFKALSTPMGMPMAGDCVMKEVCTEAQYDFDPATVPPYPDVPFPDLPGWKTSTPAEQACAQSFVTNGGYAEMSVDGESNECEQVQKVFQTVTYCPLSCNDPANAMNPECINCTNGGGGPF